MDKNVKVDVGRERGDEKNGICGPERGWGPGFSLRSGEQSSGHLREPMPVTCSLSWKGKLVISQGLGDLGNYEVNLGQREKSLQFSCREIW